jgi:hypothetical protein
MRENSEVFTLNGVEFEVEPLHPFGKRLIHHESRPLNMASWSNRDILAIVTTVQAARLLAIEGTSVEEDWSRIGPGIFSKTPHTDFSNYADVIVQALHSATGKRLPTSYSTADSLTLAAKAKLHLLEEIVCTAPSWISDEFGLKMLLETMKLDEYIYISQPPRLETTIRMAGKIFDYQEIKSGSKWNVLIGKDQAQELYNQLHPVYTALLKFYTQIAQASTRYTQNWKEHPGSTVLVSQDQRRRMDAPASLIHHFRESIGDTMTNEDPLQSNYIITSGRSYKWELPLHDYSD